MSAGRPKGRFVISELFDRLKSQQRLWQRMTVGLLLAVLLIQAGRIATKNRGDFKLHWELGRRIATGEFIYNESEKNRARAKSETDQAERPLDYPYPPFWAMAHAPLAVFSRHTAQLVLYPLVAVALFGLLWTLNRLTRGELPASRNAVFWVSAVAILLASRFIVRDAPECGVNLSLVAMSWLAVYLWTRGREYLGGTILGCAIALKCTPALFLPYFVLKRQWKMAAATTVAAGLFTLAPLLVMGPTQYSQTMTFWISHAWEGFGNPNPSVGVLGDEQIQNVSLRPAMARFLMHLPEGHKSRFEHPLSLDFLNLPPVAAGLVVKFALLMLVGGLAWRFRQRIIRRADLQVLWECATVSLMILLLSPITWGQHCVGVLPMLYLFARSCACGQAHPRWTFWLIGAFALLTLGLNRTLVGKELTWLIDSYRAPTWCLLALVAIAAGCHATHARFRRNLALGQLQIGTAQTELQPVPEKQAA